MINEVIGQIITDLEQKIVEIRQRIIQEQTWADEKIEQHQCELIKLQEQLDQLKTL